ncbi:MAG: pyrroline-5-carboxylate reductase [Proteobacteria bacterium]|nr:pyrroline-5-carboxylate reductase [Pseudomonadota bacterium]
MADRLILVGCGKMGGALLAAWLEFGIKAAAVRVVEPDPNARARFAGHRGLRFHPDAGAIEPAFAPAAVVFAVKPQNMDTVAPAYRRYTERGAVALSIAAGRTIASFGHHLGASAAIVRSMPNTPAAVGRGFTVACANAAVSDEQRALCQRLLEAVGEVAWVEDESLLDAVTAVSGSGPAYVFLLIECLARAGVASGLSKELAERLARATVTGAGELAHRSSEPAAVLRRNVTSPGGTTEAALGVLMAADGLEALMVRAVAAATRRSRELAG